RAPLLRRRHPHHRRRGGVDRAGAVGRSGVRRMTEPRVYDFETTVDRTGTGAAKWEHMLTANPAVPAGISPFSVADLDLKLAPEIIEGLHEHLHDAVLGYTVATDDYWDAVTGWFRDRHEW